MDYVAPYILTKMDISAVRKADNLAVNLYEGNQMVRAIKRFPATDSNPFAHDVEHRIAAPVVLRTGWRQEAGSNVHCFELLYMYQDQKTPTTCVLNTLRVGDGVKFVFHADYHRTPGLAESPFHADTLLLEVYRADKLHAKFELHTSICPDNTARMVKGVHTRPEPVAESVA